jgi:hypothetical protein
MPAALGSPQHAKERNVSNTETREEAQKRAALVDALLERDHYAPALLKAAVENGVPEPRSEADILAILKTAYMLGEAKAAAEGRSYPDLQGQFNGVSPEYDNVLNMAKRAFDALRRDTEGPAINKELYDAALALNRLGA